jgi:predicted HTH transcriptional regulator
VGIKDNGTVSGVVADEEYYMVESGAKLYSIPEINFKMKVHPVPNGKQVLEFIIKSSTSKPHMVICPTGTPEAYVRVHDENIIAHPVWIKIQQRMKSPYRIKYSGNHDKLLAHLRDSKAQTIETIMKEVFLSKKETTEIIVDLAVSNIIEIETTNSGLIFKLKQK